MQGQEAARRDRRSPPQMSETATVALAAQARGQGVAYSCLTIVTSRAPAVTYSSSPSRHDQTDCDRVTGDCRGAGQAHAEGPGDRAPGVARREGDATDKIDKDEERNEDQFGAAQDRRENEVGADGQRPGFPSPRVSGGSLLPTARQCHRPVAPSAASADRPRQRPATLHPRRLPYLIQHERRARSGQAPDDRVAGRPPHRC